MTDRRGEAITVLAAHGIDVAALATLTPARLAANLAGPHGQALVAALAEVGGPEVATVLVEVSTTDVPAALRKSLRRALHRLRERGVAAAAPPARGPSVAARGIGASPEPEAWISACDGVGTRLVWIAAPRPSGAWLFVVAELNEPRGLTDLRVSEVPKKQVRGARQHMRERGIAMAAVPFAVADALLVEGQARRPEGPKAPDYQKLRPRLTTRAAEPPAEPRSPHVAPPTGDEADALAARSADLLAEPELRLWWPHPDDAAPFVDEIAALDDSPIVVSREQTEERLADVLRRAAATLYPPPATARRLRATAYVFAETARPEAARMALAAAAALEADPAGRRDVAVLAALVQQGIGRQAAARAAERRQARERSLVVTPGEALTARSAGRPSRTRS